MNYAGVWLQSAGTLDVGAGDRANFYGAGDHFAGTFAGSGTVAFVGALAGLDGTSAAFVNQATIQVTPGGIVVFQGAIANSGAIDLSGATANSAILRVGSAGAALSGGGRVVLGHSIHNVLVGETSATALTNIDNKISGQGVLGDGLLILVNEAKGIINANAAGALVIDTGANAIVNAGVIAASGAGGATIAGPIDNSGQLKVAGGSTLTANGAVTGPGVALILGGTLDFTSSFSENVYFRGAAGVLELGQSQRYGGTVFGFSTTGGTSLDLRDIAFGRSIVVGFNGTATSGTLTVTDGTHTAHIKLIGDYRTSTFIVSSDGAGGTSVADPARTGAPATPSAHPLVAAMASLASPTATAAQPAVHSWRASTGVLSRPDVHFA